MKSFKELVSSLTEARKIITNPTTGAIEYRKYKGPNDKIGVLDRKDGPARIWPDGTADFYLNGKRVQPEELRQIAATKAYYKSEYDKEHGIEKVVEEGFFKDLFGSSNDKNKHLSLEGEKALEKLIKSLSIFSQVATTAFSKKSMPELKNQLDNLDRNMMLIRRVFEGDAPKNFYESRGMQQEGIKDFLSSLIKDKEMGFSDAGQNELSKLLSSLVAAATAAKAGFDKSVSSEVEKNLSQVEKIVDNLGALFDGDAPKQFYEEKILNIHEDDKVVSEEGGTWDEKFLADDQYDVDECIRFLETVLHNEDLEGGGISLLNRVIKTLKNLNIMKK